MLAYDIWLIHHYNNNIQRFMCMCASVTRTIPVCVPFQNRCARLKAGMGARARYTNSIHLS